MNAVDAYHNARQREGRILPDPIVRELPFSGNRTAHPEEWQVRRRSMDHLILSLKDRPRSMLEVGCGNGWLSSRLAEAGHSVTALDTADLELDQAKRVFADLPVKWMLGDPWNAPFTTSDFDVILFAASIQYFPDPRAVLHRCRELLKQGGEVIIIDSPIYADINAAQEARIRSVAHYASIGSPEMAAFYHHHTEGAINDAALGGRVAVIPPRGRAAASLLGPRPFPIVRIHFLSEVR